MLNYTKEQYINRPIFSSLLRHLEPSAKGWEGFDWTQLPMIISEYNYNKIYGINIYEIWQMIMAAVYERLTLAEELRYRSKKLSAAKGFVPEPQWSDFEIDPIASRLDPDLGHGGALPPGLSQKNLLGRMKNALETLLEKKWTNKSVYEKALSDKKDSWVDDMRITKSFFNEKFGVDNIFNFSDKEFHVTYPYYSKKTIVLHWPMFLRQGYEIIKSCTHLLDKDPYYNSSQEITSITSPQIGSDSVYNFSSNQEVLSSYSSLRQQATEKVSNRIEWLRQQVAIDQAGNYIDDITFTGKKSLGFLGEGLKVGHILVSGSVSVTREWDEYSNKGSTSIDDRYLYPGEGYGHPSYEIARRYSVWVDAYNTYFEGSPGTVRPDLWSQNLVYSNYSGQFSGFLQKYQAGEMFRLPTDDFPAIAPLWSTVGQNSDSLTEACNVPYTNTSKNRPVESPKSIHVAPVALTKVGGWKMK